MAEKDITKVIEIEIPKESGMEIVTEASIQPPQIHHEQEREKIDITTTQPPPPEVEPVMSMLSEPMSDYYTLTRIDTEMSDITTAHLWKKRDGSNLPQGEKIMVKLRLLNEITDYLKVNEPKKFGGERVVIRRQRRTIGNGLEGTKTRQTVTKKKTEKKPRKDCVCLLDRMEETRRRKLLILIRNMIDIDEKKVDEILQFSQQYIPELLEENVEEGQMILEEHMMGDVNGVDEN